MNHRNISCCENGRTPGIVSANPQQINQVYPVQTAILRGTLYPELDKPMACAAAHSGCVQPAASQAAAFSAWEVRLYLNTHPCDERALALYQQLCRQTPQPNYACTFAPGSPTRWAWVDDPWPWECEANGRRA